jgi:predicted outer membrane repeat protein
VTYNNGSGGPTQTATSTFQLCPGGATLYRDLDGDGFGSQASGSLFDCGPVVGYLPNNLDCNDNDAAINPNTIWYRDFDGDGLGSSTNGLLAQCAQPTGYVRNNSDNCPSIANPGQEDCNANSIGDACELVAGGVDCNANGLVDTCEIAAGISPDCDSDGRPDNCEGAVFVAAQSNLLALTGAVFAEQTFTGLVSAYGAQPTITIEATADLGAANDGVIVSVEGGTGTVYFLTDGIDCPTTPNTAVLSYGLPAFNAMVADGALTVRVSAFGAVNSATCANGGVRIKLNYTGLPPSADCNNNGVLDSCEIATGAQPDCNSNGVPDSCDIASGYSADCNSNGKPDTCDIASGASSDINANGRPDDCSGELVVGGSGFATVQAAIFAAPIGATIVVGPGVRQEYIGIDRRITLRSAAGAATTILDGAGLSQSVVNFLGADSNGAVLDGFTIRNGPNGSDFGVLGGGGVTLVQSNGTVRNCVFLNNHSDVGGAVYGILSAATIEGCTFTGNSAAVSGGAIQFELGSGWTVRDCDFTNNISAGVGGVAHAISTTGVIADCAMTGNHATGAGGAISWDSTDGGAIRVAGCSIEANFAASGGGIAVVAGIGAVDLFQSRLCRNMPDNLQGAINDLGGNIIGTDCNGNGVCDADEIAAGTAFDCNANGVLDSCDLASTTSLDCNENDIPDSCDIASGLSHDIDSNGIPDECKPDCDQDGVPDSWELSQGIEVDCNLNGRPDSCDIAASTGLDKNGNGHLDSCELARGDLNLDSAVNAADLSIMLNFWGWLNPPVGDLDGDNTVGGADLATMLNNWGTAP